MGLAESEDLGASADAGGATPRTGHAVGAAGAALRKLQKHLVDEV